jgi:type IV secretory pathway TrbL component
MLEVTGGAMTTLVPANTSVDWAAVYAESALRLKNDEHMEELIAKVTLVSLVVYVVYNFCAMCRACHVDKRFQ